MRNVIAVLGLMVVVAACGTTIERDPFGPADQPTATGVASTSARASVTTTPPAASDLEPPADATATADIDGAVADLERVIAELDAAMSEMEAAFEQGEE